MAEARAKRPRGRSNAWKLRLCGSSSAAAYLLSWSFLSGSYSQRCHGPRGGRRPRRRKPAPGGARRGSREMPEAVPRLPRRVSGFRALAGRRSLGPRVLRVGGGMEPDQTGVQSRAGPSPSLSAFLRHALLFSLCFSETGSPRTRVVSDGFELAIFLPPCRECCSDRRASPCPVDAMLGAEPSPAILFQCSLYSPGRQGWSGTR